MNTCIYPTPAPIPLPNRHDFVRKSLQEHLPIPDLTQIISALDGGYHETTALEVFDKGMTLKANRYYSTDVVSIPPGTKIKLGTLAQLTGEHFKDDAIHLSFIVTIPKECTIPPSSYVTLGVHIVEAATGKTQGCVSDTVYVPKATAMQVWVHVLLDSLVAPEGWWFELVLPTLEACNSSYQIQALYDYYYERLVEQEQQHVMFGKPRFQLLDQPSYNMYESKDNVQHVQYAIQDLKIVQDELTKTMSCPVVRLPFHFIYSFPELTFSSGSYINLGTTTELLKDSSAMDTLSILVRVSILNTLIPDAQLDLGVSQVRILAFESEANPFEENMRRPMEDWCISSIEQEPNGLHYISFIISGISSRLHASLNSRFWLLLPPLTTSSDDIHYQVNLEQRFCYKRQDIEHPTQVPWALEPRTE